MRCEAADHFGPEKTAVGHGLPRIEHPDEIDLGRSRGVCDARPHGRRAPEQHRSRGSGDHLHHQHAVHPGHPGGRQPGQRGFDLQRQGHDLAGQQPRRCHPGRHPVRQRGERRGDLPRPHAEPGRQRTCGTGKNQSRMAEEGAEQPVDQDEFAPSIRKQVIVF